MTHKAGLVFRHIHFLRSFLTCAVCMTTCFAELSFSEREVRTEVPSGTTHVTARYLVANSSTKTICIKSVTPSCGCTKAVSSKHEFLPGDQGEILVTFEVGSRVGVQLNTIQVLTDEKEALPITLVFRVDILRFIEARPALVVWSANGPIGSKQIDVISRSKSRLVHIKWMADRPDAFEITTEVSNNGDSARMQLTPRVNVSRGVAVITCTATFEDGATHVFKVYGAVH